MGVQLMDTRMHAQWRPAWHHPTHTRPENSQADHTTSPLPAFGSSPLPSWSQEKIVLCSWEFSGGGNRLGQLCPKLTQLRLAYCEPMHVLTPMGSPGLQRLSHHGCSFAFCSVGVVPFLSLQLKSVYVSATRIADSELRNIVGPPSAAKIVCMQCRAPMQHITPWASSVSGT